MNYVNVLQMTAIVLDILVKMVQVV